MQKRPLGKTELQLTPIGIGTWAIGGGDWSFGWGDQDEQEAIAGIQKGVELGVNWIDTAAVYEMGPVRFWWGRPYVRFRNQSGPMWRPSVAGSCRRTVR
jgi:aryl-alcohol dehydrogenase-like predicted oxidoreductase